MVGIRAWFLVAILIGRFWIPAFAGMTGRNLGEGMRWLQLKYDFGWLS